VTKIPLRIATLGFLVAIAGAQVQNLEQLRLMNPPISTVAEACMREETSIAAFWNGRADITFRAVSEADISKRMKIIAEDDGFERSLDKEIDRWARLGCPLILYGQKK